MCVFLQIKGFEVQNENKPLWVRAPREVEEEEYGAFFKMTFKEFMDPAAHTHFNVEGDIEFRSILFVPGMAPFDQNDMNAAKPKNIKLFVKRVFISDEFGEELLPRYLSFIKGVVDSSDLPLNVSREILQVRKPPAPRLGPGILRCLALQDSEQLFGPSEDLVRGATVCHVYDMIHPQPAGV